MEQTVTQITRIVSILCLIIFALVYVREFVFNIGVRFPFAVYLNFIICIPEYNSLVSMSISYT